MTGESCETPLIMQVNLGAGIISLYDELIGNDVVTRNKAEFMLRN